MNADRDELRASRGLLTAALIGLVIWSVGPAIGIAMIDRCLP